MFSRIAVVNRGEPAMRLTRAVRELNAEHGYGIRVIALHTESERRATFVRAASGRLRTRTPRRVLRATPHPSPCFVDSSVKPARSAAPSSSVSVVGTRVAQPRSRHMWDCFLGSRSVGPTMRAAGPEPGEVRESRAPRVARVPGVPRRRSGGTPV